MRKIPVLVFVICFESIFCSAQKEYATLCGTGHSLEIKCPNDSVISLEGVETAKGKCQDELNFRKCYNKIYNNISNNCSNKSLCILESFLQSDCNEIPRSMTVKYSCSNLFRSNHYKARICGDDLSTIQCPYYMPSLYIIGILHWEKTYSCDDCSKSSMLMYLKDICNTFWKTICNSPSNQCLFYSRHSEITFSCQNQDILSNLTTGPTIGKHKTTDYPSIYSTSSDTTDKAFQTSTILPDANPSEVWLDGNDRVLVYNSLRNVTVAICATDWNLSAATVICRYLDISCLCRPAFVTNEPFYEISPVAVRCYGNESSPFDCSLHYLGESCKTPKVAAIECCAEKECKSDTSNTIAASSADSMLGVAVGSTVGGIVILSLSIGLIFLVRRCREEKLQKSVKSKSTDDYTGQQSIAFPLYPSGNKAEASYKTKTNNLENTRTSNNTILYTDSNTIRNPSQTSKNTSKDEINVYEIANCEDGIEEEQKTIYAISKDDVYDITNENRHIIGEKAVYSRSVEDVYDQTEHNRTNRMNDDAYDHCFGQTTADDYSLSTRT